MFFQRSKTTTTTDKIQSTVVDYQPLLQHLCELLEIPEPAREEMERLIAQIKAPADLVKAAEELKSAAQGKTNSAAKKLFVEPGHYYSPIVDPTTLPQPWKRNSSLSPELLAGVIVSREQHLALWRELLPYLLEQPFTDHADSKNRYHYGSENDMFAYTDGLTLHAILRHFKPSRIVEVGSGYSSACIADTIDAHLPNTSCTFVEPYPKRLRRLLREDDLSRFTLLECPVQQAPMKVFEELESGDVLFIDSTHVLKTGSDLVYELFQILPKLRPGVIIHFHDIFYPFEYAALWVIQDNRSWNEAYALRAFLTNNPSYEILFFTDYFVSNCSDELNHDFPSFVGTMPGSLWLRKTEH